MKLPRGMTKIVDDYWDKIDEVITDRLSEIEGDIPAVLRDIDPLDPKDRYGSGSYGTAFPTSIPRWTVKLTTDPIEGYITQAVMKSKLRVHPGVAYILGVWRLGEDSKIGRGVYPIHVILRENIEPVKLQLKIKQQASLLWEIKKTGTALNTEIPDGKDFVEFQNEWIDLISEGYEYDETIIVCDFMNQFYNKFGTVLADVHVGNVGYRTHDLSDLVANHVRSRYWVTFDLGHSSFLYEEEAPRIKNPPRVEMIW